MDIFKYPKPVAKMTVEIGNISSTKSTHERAVLGHHFNHAVSVVLPNTGKLDASLFDEDDEYYIARKVPLQKFISEEFIGAFIKKGSFYAMTIDTRIDVDNCIAIIPPGFLIMSVDKDTYESLGLQGERSQFHRNSAHKFIAKLDMTLKSFAPGRNLYEKAAKMLCGMPLLDFIFNWIPHDQKISSLSVKTYVESWGVETETCFSKERFACGRNIQVPDITSLLRNGDDNKYSHAEFFEWLGAYLCGINCSAADIDDSVSTFYCHEPSKHLDLITTVHWTGFIPPQNILNLLQKLRNLVTQRHAGIPWIAMTVHGFSDSLFSWEKNEHGFDMDGDNLYCFVIFPDSQY